MGIIFLIVLGLLVVICGGYLAGIYNQLVSVRVNVDKSWSNIEVLEKQRYDEIPKLVKICEGHMRYERETLEKVIEARTRYLAAQGPAAKGEAGSQMAGALKSLFAVAESYPDLKASQSFLQLQGRITALENEIADRREFYNDSVTILNTRIDQIPYVVFARLLNYAPREMYKVAAAERAVPEIKFAFPR
jgi:LemA protein